MGGSWGHVAMESMPFGTLFFMRYVFGAVGNERLGRASPLSCLWRNCKTKRERENVPRGSGASFFPFWCFLASQELWYVVEGSSRAAA